MAIASLSSFPSPQLMNSEHEPPSVLEPLEDHPKYQKVSAVQELEHIKGSLEFLLVAPDDPCMRRNLDDCVCAPWQIRDLDKGTFGFVQLAVDLTTGEQVAIKFIERSQEVHPCSLLRLKIVIARRTHAEASLSDLN